MNAYLNVYKKNFLDSNDLRLKKGILHEDEQFTPRAFLYLSRFEENPKADVIIFNFLEEMKDERVVKKNTRIGYHNYMNYSAARIAFRRKSIIYHAILFNTMFGGGTPHQCGEDT